MITFCQAVSGKAQRDTAGMQRWGRLREEDQKGPRLGEHERGWRERDVLSLEFSTRSDVKQGMDEEKV